MFFSLSIYLESVKKIAAGTLRGKIKIYNYENSGEGLKFLYDLKVD